jgi:hypothetical protein
LLSHAAEFFEVREEKLKMNKLSFGRSMVVPGLILSLALTALSADEGRSVILPESAAAELSKGPCSRSAPPKFESTWTPTADDIKSMESRFALRARLIAKHKLEQMQPPKTYNRQYLGIVVGGRKLIYINAFCDDELPADWRDKLVNYCDGGWCFWGVVYDTVSHSFSHLEINGIA